MIYSGPYSQISTTISISMLINQPSDLDNESQNNAWVFDSSQNNWADTTSNVEKRSSRSSRWTDKQVKVLLEAHNQCLKIREEKWKEVAEKVKKVRPEATPKSCRTKYERLINKTFENKDGTAAMLGLMQLKDAQSIVNESLTIDSNTTLKRRSESLINNSSPSKRQKISSKKWTRWTPDENSKLIELVNQTESHKKGRWTEISENMGDKTPLQCENKWQVLKKIISFNPVLVE
ncbi:MAG: hypothetical protein BGO14_02745 [Chlamydiales bacterium 38-26]|nr:myb/SANT-like DNA-binding domain-containing protein [Chlamydiales bacterium]OJV09269.1 MAG: hypothetical protein BGO14_02745 [Chlamydiales bacterium 38-26]